MKIVFEETDVLSKREREWLVELNKEFIKKVDMNERSIVDRRIRDIEDDSMLDFLNSNSRIHSAIIGFIEACLINNELPEFEKNNN